ncbi:RelA/SpoT [Sesbania bispinosa]|nr:RelA/SpoT [Sesbania bispinosa]
METGRGNGGGRTKIVMMRHNNGCDMHREGLYFPVSSAISNAIQVNNYIATPKLNGYQSLQTTMIPFLYESMFRLEVQIKIEEKDLITARGIAAHYSGREFVTGFVGSAMPSGKISRGKIVCLNNANIELRNQLNSVKEIEKRVQGDEIMKQLEGSFRKEEESGDSIVLQTITEELEEAKKESTFWLEKKDSAQARIEALKGSEEEILMETKISQRVLKETILKEEREAYTKTKILSRRASSEELEFWPRKREKSSPKNFRRAISRKSIKSNGNIIVAKGAKFQKSASPAVRHVSPFPIKKKKKVIPNLALFSEPRKTLRIGIVKSTLKKDNDRTSYLLLLIFSNREECEANMSIIVP